MRGMLWEERKKKMKKIREIRLLINEGFCCYPALLIAHPALFYLPACLRYCASSALSELQTLRPTNTIYTLHTVPVVHESCVST